ncbi:MAG TPA: TonB-dependent receptor [Planctomycetota bacterium]|nr:TonB-dependent receptor [Planctomycetota bacterium]
MVATLCTQVAAGAQDAQDHDLIELSLEELLQVEVVTTASKVQQTTFEAPGFVTVVTREDIDTYGWRTLADVLRGVPGFWVFEDRNYSRLGVRGFGPLGDYNSRVLLLIDGHRTNNNVYDTAAIGLEFPLDIALVERIEIVRGPGSALYGSNAFFGVINVVTRRGDELRGPELEAQAGTYADMRGRATWGGAHGEDGEWLASATVFGMDGPDLFYPEFVGDPNGPVTYDNDGERGLSAFVRWSKGDWRVESAWVSREKEIPTGSFGTVYGHPGNFTVDEQGYVDLLWERALSDELELSARAFYDRYLYRGEYIYDDTPFGGPPDLVNDDRGDGEWVGSELRATWSGWARQRWTVGTEVRSNLTIDQYNADDVYGQYLDDRRDGVVLGVYAQDEIRLAPRLGLSLGVRHDHYEDFGGTTNPRAALVWQPSERTAWKLIAGRAFRAPNAYEMFYDDGYTAKANSALEPEEVTTFEAVLEHQFGRHLRGSLAIYHYDIDGLIVQTIDPGDGLLQFVNAASASGPGAEVQLERRWEQGARVLVGYAWQDVEDETGAELVNSPEHTASLRCEFPLWSNRSLVGLELLALDERGTLAGDTAGGYVVTNLTLSTGRLTAGFEASLSVFNLLDEDYADPGQPETTQDLIARNGRTLVARLRWSR